MEKIQKFAKKTENKQNVQNQNFSKIPLKEKKVNKKQNSRTKPFQQKPGRGT